MKYLFYMSAKVLMAAIVFSLCFVTAKASISESVQIENPRVVLKVSETRILPFEAVSFALAVSNDSDEIHTINGIPLTFIEYRKVVPGKIGWTNYEKYNYGMSTISDPPLQPVNMFFAPNSVYELGIHTIDFDLSGKQVFDQPGEYAIRATYGIVSEPVYITVTKPTGKDAAAHKYINKNGLYKLLSEENLSVFPYDKKSKRLFDKLTARFPQSRYAQLSRIAVSLMLIKGIDGKTDPGMAKKILEVVEKSPDAYLKVRAKYYKAVACFKLNELDAAKQLFQEVGTQNINPYLRFLSERIVASQDLIEVEQIHKGLIN